MENDFKSVYQIQSIRVGLEKGIIAGIKVQSYRKCFRYSTEAGVEEAAFYMRENGIDIEFIHAMTALPVEKIKTLDTNNFYHFALENEMAAMLYPTNEEELELMEGRPKPMSPIRGGVQAALLELIFVVLPELKKDEKLSKELYEEGLLRCFYKGVDIGLKEIVLHMIKCEEKRELIRTITGFSLQEIEEIEKENLKKIKKQLEKNRNLY